MLDKTENVLQQNAKCDTELDPAWKKFFFLFDPRIFETLMHEENET